MTSGPWDEEAVFQIARKIAVPQDRDRYLDQVCGNDAQRRKRIEALLKVDEGELSFPQIRTGSKPFTTSR
jgi:hypothetical protein